MKHTSHICHQREISVDKELSKNYLEAMFASDIRAFVKQGFGTNDVHVTGYNFTAELRQVQSCRESMPGKSQSCTLLFCIQDWFS